MFNDLQNRLGTFLTKEVLLIPWHSAEVKHNYMNLGLGIHYRESVDDFISMQWDGIAGNLILTQLLYRIKDLVLVSDKQTGSPIGIGYVYYPPSMQGSPSLFLGYPPVNIDTGDRISYQFPSLLSYISFIKIHNGFVHEGNHAIGIRAFTNLVSLIDNKGEKYLGFCGDGLGNYQCLPAALKQNESEIMTCDWDHETRETSGYLPFWSFITEFLKRELGDTQ